MGRSGKGSSSVFVGSHDARPSDLSENLRVFGFPLNISCDRGLASPLPSRVSHRRRLNPSGPWQSRVPLLPPSGTTRRYRSITFFSIRSFPPRSLTPSPYARSLPPPIQVPAVFDVLTRRGSRYKPMQVPTPPPFSPASEYFRVDRRRGASVIPFSLDWRPFSSSFPCFELAESLLIVGDRAFLSDPPPSKPNKPRVPSFSPFLDLVPRLSLR